MSTTQHFTTTRPTAVTDTSGFAVFSDGDVGAAHAMAHRMLDEGRYDEGRVQLGRFLDQHTGSGSKWAHLQWHMAVFEIAAGQSRAALARFEEHILPAIGRGEAHTDGPSLLWRLCLSGDRSIEIDWGPVHEEALASVSLTDDPFVELHHHLALVGSGDLPTVDRWLDEHYESGAKEDRQLLLQVVWGLRSFRSGDFEVASVLLQGVLGRLGTIGGSRAQNELFQAIADEASRRARTQDSIAA